MGSYSSASVVCPYYLSDDPKTCSLTCEGIPPGSSIKSHFLDGRRLREQIKKYCAGDYKSCPWCRVLEMKYGE